MKCGEGELTQREYKTLRAESLVIQDYYLHHSHSIPAQKCCGAELFAAGGDELVDDEIGTVAAARIERGDRRQCGVRLSDDILPLAQLEASPWVVMVGAHHCFGRCGGVLGGVDDTTGFGEELAVTCVGLVLRCGLEATTHDAGQELHQCFAAKLA